MTNTQLQATSPKVSVIIAVYNAEKFLSRAVDSVLNQTMTDFELLLINDGSKDKSGEICDQYAQQDSRIRVFHQENQGVAKARQVGTDNALGEYVIHCDADDWIESDELSSLYQKAQQESADMVICDYYEDNILWGGVQRTLYSNQQPTDLLDNHRIIEDLLLAVIHGSCCNKLIKLDTIRKYNIRYQPLQLCEDQLFNIQLLQHPIKVVYLNKAFYHYTDVNPLSIVRLFNDKAIDIKKAYIATLPQIVPEETKLIQYQKFMFRWCLFISGRRRYYKDLYPEVKTNPFASKRRNRFYRFCFSPFGFMICYPRLILKKTYYFFKGVLYKIKG